MNSRFRTLGYVLAGAAVAGIVATLVVRRQIDRHRRDLFSPNSLRRLAALSHMSKEVPSVDGVMVLRDFISWEPRRALRNRARQILGDMEVELRDSRGSDNGRRTELEA